MSLTFISVMLIQDILSKDPELGFIDIGANIGTYTLAMAKMNRKVTQYSSILCWAWPAVKEFSIA